MGAQPAGTDQRAHAPTELVVVVGVGGRPLALRGRDVLEVRPLCLVSPLPEAPRLVEGVVDAHGELVAVLDLGPRLGLPPRDAQVDDMLVLVATARRRLALHVDHDVDVRTVPVRALDDAARALAPQAAGVAVLDDGLVVVHDVEAFLAAADEAALARALARLDPTGAR